MRIVLLKKVRHVIVLDQRSSTMRHLWLLRFIFKTNSINVNQERKESGFNINECQRKPLRPLNKNAIQEKELFIGMN